MGVRQHLRAPATAFVRLTQYHGVAPYTGNKAILVAQYFHWIGQQTKDNTFLLCVLHFFRSCRQFLPPPPINDGHSSAAAQGTACCVHRYIAAANDDYLFGRHQGSHGIWLGCMHQVDAGQPLIRGKYAAQRFAGNAHKIG